MDQSMKENFNLMIFTGLEHIHGLTIEFIKVNGIKIKCMERVVLNGRMGSLIKVITLRIKNMDRGSSSGLMDESTLVTGKMENKMELGYII